MLAKASFLLSHYAYLALFVFGFWGVGRFLLHRVLKRAPNDAMVAAVLAVLLGQGVLIVALQGLGVGAVLNKNALTAWLVGAAGLAAFEGRHFAPSTWLKNLKRSWRGRSTAELLGLLLLLIFAFPTLLEPLRPPGPGDELHYHLPHVQQWVESGRLTVNEWLRYPWFPYNYHLLYASAYLMHGDVFTHLFNALAGWLMAILIYRTAWRHFSPAVAVLACLIWFHLNRHEFGKTNVDMGVAVYAFAATLVFFQWLRTPHDRRWLAVSGFLLGIAIGSKYQALFLLPIFGLAILLKLRKDKENRLGTLVIAGFSVLAPCVYWYARNAWLTGDPFNPIGGKLFGFTDWNLSDYQTQFADLKRVAAWPSVLLWPAALALWGLRSWADKMQASAGLHRWATLLCAYFFVAWMVTSRYPRYLLPVVPWLAMLAAEKWRDLFSAIGMRISAVMSPSTANALQSALWMVVFTGAVLSSANSAAKYSSHISPTPEARHTLLRQEIKGYGVLDYLSQHPAGRIYNAGLGDVVYYAPHPIWGDVFGPWRYRDIVSDDPVTFASQLSDRAFDAAIVDERHAGALESHPAFASQFVIEVESQGIKLYRVKKQ